MVVEAATPAALEALAELYQVWPNDKVRERLHEMFVVVRDSFTTDKGYMNLYFEPDWSPDGERLAFTRDG